MRGKEREEIYIERKEREKIYREKRERKNVEREREREEIYIEKKTVKKYTDRGDRHKRDGPSVCEKERRNR